MNLKNTGIRLFDKLQNAMPWLTRQRAAVFALTLIAVGIALEGVQTETSADVAADFDVIPLTLPQRDALSGIQPSWPSETELKHEASEWVEITVRPGDTLGSIFRRQGFSANLLHRIIQLDESTKGLKNIRPGDVFQFELDDSGGFQRMRYPISDSQYLIVSMALDDLQMEILEREIVTEIREAEGVVTSSLFAAAKSAGLSDAMTMDLANIFAWDIDFVLDLREGDRFFLIYEELYREGEFLRDGRILAATFINQAERYRAVRFDSHNESAFFDPDGRNMRKEFLRAPLNFSYISSGFNPRRMHPILKRVRPHNGIDYYAPRGTPVYAAGGGSVTRSAYSKTNGHHVFIKHDGGIETRYLHFTSRAVKEGQKVRQGQTIGYVGSTGLASGPHLHYEFLVDGVHRNPRTVPLPKIEPLEGGRLVSFHETAAPLLTRLSRLESASLYASRE